MPISADLYQPIAHHASFSVNEEQQLLKRGILVDVGAIELSKLEVGEIRYPLRQPLKGTYYYLQRTLYFDGVDQRIFAGSGDSSEEAVADFVMNVHQTFQELVTKRPFEMTPQDKTRWDTLNEIIDTTRYRNVTPIRVRQLGEVLLQKHSYPRAIRWDNGYVENVDLAKVAEPDFVSYKHGQPVEAVVVRDPLTRELLHIPFICRVRSLRSTTELDDSKLVDQFGSSSDLPDATWD